MLDKGVVGNANGGVIHYIVNFGFSVGVSDIFPSKEV